MKVSSHEAISGIAILLQATIIQLIEAGAISIDEAERIFDAAEKVAHKSSPGAVQTIAHTRDKLNFDKLRSAQRKRP